MTHRTSITLSLAKQWLRFGIKFGYPDCCIKYFLEVELVDRYDPKLNMFLGSGYIPCNACKDVAMDEQEDRINKRRDLGLEPFKRPSESLRLRMLSHVRLRKNLKKQRS